MYMLIAIRNTKIFNHVITVLSEMQLVQRNATESVKLLEVTKIRTYSSNIK